MPPQESTGGSRHPRVARSEFPVRQVESTLDFARSDTASAAQMLRASMGGFWINPSILDEAPPHVEKRPFFASRQDGFDRFNLPAGGSVRLTANLTRNRRYAAPLSRSIHRQGLPSPGQIGDYAPMESNKAVKETLESFAVKLTAFGPDSVAEIAEIAFEMRIAADVLGELSPHPAFPEAEAALSLSADILDRAGSGRLSAPIQAIRAAAGLLRTASRRIPTDAGDSPARDVPEPVDLLREMLRTSAELEQRDTHVVADGPVVKHTNTPM